MYDLASKTLDDDERNEVKRKELFMKSVCIKTNNSNLLNYLLNELDYIEVEHVIISSNEFKNYKNIIVHYRGNENNKFIHEISCIL